MDPEFVTHFGSRGGSFTALAFSSALFGLLAVSAGRQCRRRGWGSPWGMAIALALFIGPLGLLYASWPDA